MTTMLVPLAPPAEKPGPVIRPLAGFVAHVIACDLGLAGQKRRRRAEPPEASALYRAREESGARPGRRAERSV